MAERNIERKGDRHKQIKRDRQREQTQQITN